MELLNYTIDVTEEGFLGAATVTIALVIDYIIWSLMLLVPITLTIVLLPRLSLIILCIPLGELGMFRPRI